MNTDNEEDRPIAVVERVTRYRGADGRRVAVVYTHEPTGRHVVRAQYEGGDGSKWRFDTALEAADRWNRLADKLIADGFAPVA